MTSNILMISLLIVVGILAIAVLTLVNNIRRLMVNQERTTTELLTMVAYKQGGLPAAQTILAAAKLRGIATGPDEAKTPKIEPKIRPPGLTIERGIR